MPLVCRICLRSDIAETKDSDKTLVEFHVELCENNVVVNPTLKFCTICEHQLKKFFDFRQKCRRSNEVLQTWKETNVPESLANLQELISPSSITVQKDNAKPEFMKFLHTNIAPTELIIKLEKEDSTAKAENSTIIAEEIKLDSELNLQNTDLLNDTQNLEKKLDGIDLKVEDNYYCEVDIFNDDFDDDDDYVPEKTTPKRKITKTRSKTKLDRKVKLKYKETEEVENVKEELKLADGEKITERRRKFSKNQCYLRDRVLELLDRGELQDLGENVKMSREVFLKMFEKCKKTGLRCTMLPMKPDSSEEQQRLRNFLLYLLKKNNPEYEDMFHIELLDTDAKKLAEFKRRKLSKEYLEAEFKCEICFKVFEVLRLLDYHKKWHEPGSGAHVCYICAMRFAQRKSLAQHLKDNHCTVYRCKLCPLLTYNFSVMVNHFHHHKGKEYSCPVCLSVFSNKSTMNNHRLQAHKTSHICALCARCFVSEKGLYFHKRLKHKDEVAAKSEHSVTCDKCDATLTSPEVLHAHIRQMHSAQTIHKCFHCKEIFSSLEELKKHKVELDHQRSPKPLASKTSVDGTKTAAQLSTDEKATCEECDKCFNSRKSYLRHFNINHNANRIHKCGFCQAKFTSAEEIDAHRIAYNHHPKVRYVKKLRKHNAGTKRLKCNKPFEKCELCDEMVSTARHNTMYQHFQAAHPDVPYTSVYANPHNRHLCEECGKTFKDLRFFLDHKNLHTGEKPYPCNLCSRTYATKRHLTWHMERHGPPRHQCKECGKMFNSAGNLFAHRRGHVGDRRFKCEICAKGFLHQAALNEHVRGVHNHIRRARKCRDK